MEVDLRGEFPKHIKIGIRKGYDVIVEKFISIKDDYIPKYYTTCKIQGHDQEQCYIKHP